MFSHSSLLVLVNPYMLSWRMKEEIFWCLKYLGRMCSVNPVILVMIKQSPSSAHLMNSLADLSYILEMVTSSISSNLVMKTGTGVFCLEFLFIFLYVSKLFSWPQIIQNEGINENIPNSKIYRPSALSHEFLRFFQKKIDFQSLRKQK